MANLRDIKKRNLLGYHDQADHAHDGDVSTAKIRRALDRSKQAEPYKEALTDVMLTVARRRPPVPGTDPMLQKHESVKHGLIVVIASWTRGLAGGFQYDGGAHGRKARRFLGERRHRVRDHRVWAQTGHVFP